MKFSKRLISLFLAVFILAAAVPMQVLAADTIVYATNGGYIGMNRYTGVISQAVNLTGDLVIPATIQGVTVTAIADSTFYGFDQLTSVELPDTVTSVGDSAFGACTALKSVVLGENVSYLGKNVFKFCYSLTDIVFSYKLTSIESYAFASCLSLETITIPSGVTSIGDYAFSECTRLKNITFPNTVTKIGPYAFNKCTALESIVLPEGLTSVETALFYDCTALSSVSIPKTCLSIESTAFRNCTSLETLALPEGVVSVNDWAFIGAENLTKISMPDSITSIGPDAFYGCDNITFYVNAGSYAQVHASANGIPFEIGTFGNGNGNGDDPIVYPPTGFTDIQGHWAQESIEWACANGYFKGITDTTFGPNLPVLRSMLVTVLYRVEGEPAVNGVASFGDVPANSYYAPAVRWAEITGVVSGTSATTFSPSRQITREQLATMLYRYASYKGLDTSNKGSLASYTDVSRVSNYAQEAMRWAVGTGVITGKTPTTLEPRGNATRAETVTMLRRFISLG